MDISQLKPIEAGGVDVSAYEGRQSSIETLEIVDIQSAYGDDGKELPEGKTRMVKCLKVASEPVRGDDGNPVMLGETPLRASELFNLSQDDDGNWGYSTSENSNIQKLFAKLKVSSPGELTGKKITLKTRGNFLGFYYK